jgi:hypothetical protein
VVTLPKGPQGQKALPSDRSRHAAIMVARLATGEIEDKPSPAPNRAKRGRIGGKARAQQAFSGAKEADARDAAK